MNCISATTGHVQNRRAQRRHPDAEQREDPGRWRDVAERHGERAERPEPAIQLLLVPELLEVGGIPRRLLARRHPFPPSPTGRRLIHRPDAAEARSAATMTSMPASVKRCRYPSEQPSSTISASTSSRGAITKSATVPIFEWSATTSTRPRVCSIITRAISASAATGVVSPDPTLIPSTPMKALVACVRRRASVANGPRPSCSAPGSGRRAGAARRRGPPPRARSRRGWSRP